MSKGRQPIIWFYIIGGYVMLQFAWWAYLLVENQLFIDQLIESIASSPYENTKGSQYLMEYNTQSKILMILGEGAVFLFLLITGLFFLKRSFEKERTLRHVQQNFLLSISHELNTPLAGIRLNLETLKTRKLTPEQAHILTTDAFEESTRLQHLIKNVLTAVQIDANQKTQHTDIVSLSDETSRCVKHMEQQFPNARISATIEPDIFIQTDKTLLYTIPRNLIENAIKYGGQPKEVDVLVRSENQEAILEVNDNGKGIPVEERKNVLSKFYRIHDERTREASGTGLGLFLVHQIVALHKGKLSLGESKKNGLHVKISFPLAKAE